MQDETRLTLWNKNTLQLLFQYTFIHITVWSGNFFSRFSYYTTIVHISVLEYLLALQCMNTG